MGKPPEVPDSGPAHEEVVETIHEATNDIDFGPEFMTDLLLFFRENARKLFSGQTTFFILGSYREYPIRRLHFAAQELNNRPMTCAFVLCDLLDPGELRDYWSENGPEDEGPADASAEETTDPEDDTDVEDLSPPASHCQFYLLATYCDYVVPIFEGRHAGPSVELSELRNNFFDKSHAFRRDYGDLGSEDRDVETLNDQELGSGNKIDPDVDLPNPYSQPQEDLFALFDARSRLYRWERRVDLATEIQSLPDG